VEQQLEAALDLGQGHLHLARAQTILLEQHREAPQGDLDQLLVLRQVLPLRRPSLNRQVAEVLRQKAKR